MRGNALDRGIPILLAATLLLAIAAVVPSSAGAAATVALSGGFKKTLTYSAAASEQTSVIFYAPGYPGDRTLVIDTSGNTMVDGDGAWGCTVNDPHHATCPGTWVSNIKLNGSDKGDTLLMFPTVQFAKTTIDGNGGNDYIVGASTGDTLNGGSGDDHIWGEAIGVSGFPQGNDRISGGSGSDTIDGVGGIDSVTYSDHSSPVSVSLLTGKGGNASEDGTDLDAISNVEDVLGTDNTTGIDWLEGDENRNTLNGAKGTDVLIGNGGNDLLYGDDGGFDLLAGGTGSDILIGGKGDDWMWGGPDADTMADGLFSPGSGTNHFFGNDDGAQPVADWISCSSYSIDNVTVDMLDSIANESLCAAVNRP